MDLQSFVRSQIVGLTRSPALRAPRLSTCLRVRQVAQGSVASAAGIEVSDVLVAVDGRPAGRLDPRLYRTHVPQRRYLFHHDATSEQVDLATSGIEIGLDLAPTVEAVEATFDPKKKDDSEALLELWHAGAFDVLARLASAAVKTYEPGFFGKLLGSAPDRNTPTLVLLAAALFELGERREAAALFREYDQRYAGSWTTEYSGIGDYYHARVALEGGNVEEARRAAWRAHSACGFDRTAELVARLEGERPPNRLPRWLGKPFPADYALPALDGGSAPVALGPTLRELGPGQVAVVCLLLSYRGNGPYNDFMQRFRNYGSFFGPYVRGLHVVTSEPAMRPDRPHWFEAEGACRSMGLPFRVLFDADDRLGAALEPPGSPTVYVLDRNARVAHEGELMPCELWEAVHRAAVGGQ